MGFGVLSGVECRRRRNGRGGVVCSVRSSEKNLERAVIRARRAVISYKEKYQEARRRAEEFKTNGVFLVGADMEITDTTEVEDIDVPLKDHYISSELDHLIQAIGDKFSQGILDQVRSLVEADIRPLRERIEMGLAERDKESLLSLHELVMRAGFRHLPATEFTEWNKLDRYADAVPVSVQDFVVEQPFKGSVNEGLLSSNCLNPAGLAFCRGFDFKRDSGVLLGQKLRGLQAGLLRSIEEPVSALFNAMFELRRAVLRSALNRTQEKKEDGRTESFEEKNKDRNKYLSRKVRRVTVPAYWNGDFGEFFLPTYTQEPSTKQLLFIFNGTEDLEGAEPLQMKLYDDVAFAAVSAFFPGGIVIPSTFDILRLDLLTITGLIASITSFFTRIDNKFASWVAAGTLLQYLVRVFVNFINITAQYKERRGRQQLDSISAQGNAVLLVLQDYVQDLEVKTGLLLLGSPLLANGSQARADDLRAEAEQFLEDHVGEEVDLRRSVPRVLRILREGGFVDLETGFVRLTDKSNLLMRVENGMDQTL